MSKQDDRFNWEDEDAFWRANYRDRPYVASSGRDYDFYQPGYRYGFESARQYSGRSWDDVESDLSTKWNSYEHRGKSTWAQVKDAVHDAWDRVTGKHHVGAH